MTKQDFVGELRKKIEQDKASQRELARIVGVAHPDDIYKGKGEEDA